MASKTKSKRRFDWSKADAMTDEERQQAVQSDPDASVPTDDQLKRARRVSDWPLCRRIRHDLRLTQAEFAERYQLPIGTIRDWEQGRVGPDAAAQALLKAIAANPRQVAKALEATDS